MVTQRQSETVRGWARGSRRSVPPHLFFVGSAVFHYLGPAFAVLLFARVAPLGVAWLRISLAAAVFVVWRRPWRPWSRLDRSERMLVVLWAGVLASMNCCFYLAINRLPLGTVAAIEFLPVAAIAALAVRTRRNLLAVVLAAGGVFLVSDVHLSRDITGLGLAVANAVLFAGYIVLAHRAAHRPQLAGIDALALAMVAAAVVALPIGLVPALAAFGDVRLLAAALGVAVCSSVLPYVLDQLAMARLPRGTYALLVSLLPATATLVGLLVLRQVPTILEAAGVALVVTGVALHHDTGHDDTGHRGPDRRDSQGEVVS